MTGLNIIVAGAFQTDRRSEQAVLETKARQGLMVADVDGSIHPLGSRKYLFIVPANAGMRGKEVFIVCASPAWFSTLPTTSSETPTRTM
jgi:hypothetical protein